MRMRRKGRIVLRGPSSRIAQLLLRRSHLAKKPERAAEIGGMFESFSHARPGFRTFTPVALAVADVHLCAQKGIGVRSRDALREFFDRVVVLTANMGNFGEQSVWGGLRWIESRRWAREVDGFVDRAARKRR